MKKRLSAPVCPKRHVTPCGKMGNEGVDDTAIPRGMVSCHNGAAGTEGEGNDCCCCCCGIPNGLYESIAGVLPFTRARRGRWKRGFLATARHAVADLFSNFRFLFANERPPTHVCGVLRRPQHNKPWSVSGRANLHTQNTYDSTRVRMKAPAHKIKNQRRKTCNNKKQNLRTRSHTPCSLEGKAAPTARSPCGSFPSGPAGTQCPLSAAHRPRKRACEAQKGAPAPASPRCLATDVTCAGGEQKKDLLNHGLPSPRGSGGNKMFVNCCSRGVVSFGGRGQRMIKCSSIANTFRFCATRSRYRNHRTYLRRAVKAAFGETFHSAVYCCRNRPSEPFCGRPDIACHL